MAKSKEEQIFIQIGDEIQELKGAEKEAFLADRAQIQSELDARKTQFETQKQIKIAAYEKLGLTDEEINAIL